MTTSRRDFLKQTSGLALVIAVPLTGCRRAPADPPFTPNQWIEIGANDRITLVLDKCEMGQGVTTSLPLIMAEELGADLARIDVIPASPGPRFPDMSTSGSGSVSGAWRTHRLAAAAARTVLVGAAAERWGVPVDRCYTEGGFVRERDTRRRLRFGALVAAARELPVPAEPAFKPAGDYTLIGKVVADRSVPAIVTGQIRYGIDARTPGMLYATILRPPHVGARPIRIDQGRAEETAGVSRIVTTEAGIAVVANSTWAAMKGRDALEVEWTAGPQQAFDNADGWRRLEAAFARGGRTARSSGNGPRAVAAAATRFSAEYRWTWQAHAAIEPLSCLAHVRDGGCEIWAGTQRANGAQTLVARALGIPEEQVRINLMRLGGGFGRRIASDYIVEAARVSQAIGGPVQVVWTREDDFVHDKFGPAQMNRLAAGVDGTGRVVGWTHRVADFHLSMFGGYDPAYDPAEDGNPWGGFDNPYEIEDMLVELALVEAPVPTGAWRAVSYPAAVLARECFLDEMAHATGQDPVAFRLRLIPSPGTVRRGPVSFDNGDRLRRVLETVAARSGWGQPLAERSDGRRAGRGIACNPYHEGTMVAQVAEVSVGAEGDIRVERIVSAVDCGLVIDPTGVEKQFEGAVGWALSALLGPGVTFAAGRAVTATFGDYPILRVDQMPRVETHTVAGAARPFGLGEPPVPAIAPAVLNAVFAATGERIRSLPLAPNQRGTPVDTPPPDTAG